jgi:hypothetical protein
MLNRLRKNATKQRKGFLQGLKPVESTQFASALKHRPPEEKKTSSATYKACATFLVGLLEKTGLVVRFVGSRCGVGLGDLFCVNRVQRQRLGLPGAHRHVFPGTEDAVARRA